MNSFIKFLKKFVEIYDEVEIKVLVASLGVTVLLIFAQITMRSIFNNSITWSEELARYLFIWQTWLGVSVGLRDNKHIRVELIFQLMKGKKAVMFNIAAAVFSLLMCIFLVKYGTKIVQNAYLRHTLSPALRCPLWIIYMSVPVSCFVTSIRYICQIVVDFKKLFGPGEDASSKEVIEA